MLFYISELPSSFQASQPFFFVLREREKIVFQNIISFSCLIEHPDLDQDYSYSKSLTCSSIYRNRTIRKNRLHLSSQILGTLKESLQARTGFLAIFGMGLSIQPTMETRPSFLQICSPTQIMFSSLFGIYQNGCYTSSFSWVLVFEGGLTGNLKCPRHFLNKTYLTIRNH